MAEATPTVERTNDVGPGQLPEFRIVVRHADRRGPLGPYRLALSVVVVLLVFGSTIYSMTLSGTPDDGVLLRAAAVGLLVWITTGVVSSALAAAETPHRPVRDADD